MKQPDIIKCIGRQRPKICIIRMGCNQCIFQCGWSTDLNNNRSMAKDFPTCKFQLHKVSRHQLVQRRNLNAKRSWTYFRSGHKVSEIRNTGPGGRFLVGINIIPSISWCIVHYLYTLIQALRGKIGAIPSQIFIIIISRISTVSPTMCVGYRCKPVIWNNLRYRVPLPS